MLKTSKVLFINSFILIMSLLTVPGFSQDDSSSVKLHFSKTRGFYQNQFTLTILTEPAELTVFYTKDGSNPVDSRTAIKGNSPVQIQINPGNTSGRDRAPGFCVRAVAIQADTAASKVKTHTYLFVDRVVELSPDGQKPGSGWLDENFGGGQNINYGMDAQVVNSALYRNQIVEALTDIPTLSMVMDLDDLFDRNTGIYVNAAEHGVEWERPCSIELLNPDGSKGFQVNAGVRIRGGWSRNDSNPKRAFRWFFRSEYGDAKLRYPLFGDEGVDEFDKMDLRTSMNYSWSYDGSNLNTMNRDVFSRDLQRDMGQPYTRSRYYHLYINGTYWGLYQTQERSEAAFAASYFGGNREDYDVVKVDAGYQRSYELEATDGTLEAWRRLWDAAQAGFQSDAAYYKVQGLNPDGTPNPNYEVLLDVDNLIDYMLIVFVSGDYDAPVSNFSGNENPNNYYSIYNRVNPDGFKFFRHDAEHTMRDHEWGYDRTGPFPAGSRFEKSNPQWIHQKLAENAIYRSRIADRVYQEFFNGGELTPERNIQRFMSRAREIEMAIIAESARWGDSKREPAFTKDNAWYPALEWITDVFFPPRTDLVLNQIIAQNWYPQMTPARFNVSTGRVDKGFLLSMTAPAGEIYYTTDGRDPFEPESVSASTTVFVEMGAAKKVFIPAQDIGSNWRSQLNYNDAAWKSGDGFVGYERNNGYENLIDLDVESDLPDKQTSCYVRIPFTVANGALEEINSLILRMLYDDGFVVFLNGVEVLRRLAPDQLEWNAAATENHEADSWETFLITEHLAQLAEGENLLAIHGLNVNLTSSDFLLATELVGSSAGTRGSISPSAVVYAASPVSVEQSMTVNARVLYNNNWSAMNSVELFVLEGADNLRITEIHYHPLDQDSAIDDDSRYEFIELKNTGNQVIDLAGWQFARGISYTFPASARIQGQQFFVLASDQEAFTARYGFLPGGEFEGQLDNSGETVALIDAALDTVIQLRYNDKYPWPQSADGDGYSLVVRDVNPYGDPDNAGHWIASSQKHGTPGEDDTVVSVSNADAVSPETFQLYQNYPNPFNPETTIEFDVPEGMQVKLSIYNLLGQEVETLINRHLPQGHFVAHWNARGAAGGVYLLRLESQTGVRTRKMILLR